MASPARASFEVSLVDFLNSLMTKTQQRGLVWVRGNGVITTHVRDGLIAQFMTNFDQLHSEVWNSFAIYGTEGNEIFRATPTSSANAKCPFAAVLGILFRSAQTSTREPVYGDVLRRI